MKKSLVMMLLVSVFLTGCYGTVYVRDTSPVVYYEYGPRTVYGYPVAPRGYRYVPTQRELRSKRCDIPGYALMIMSDMCEWNGYIPDHLRWREKLPPHCNRTVTGRIICY